MVLSDVFGIATDCAMILKAQNVSKLCGSHGLVVQHQPQDSSLTENAK